MTNIANIAEKQLHDPAYLKAVTELGDGLSLVTTREIHSETGIKLVNAGVRFNSSLYDKLMQHKLVPTLDQALSIENPVTNANLIEQLPVLLAEDGWLQPMRSSVLDQGIFENILAQVHLHPTIAFKLTVMRETRPELFRHSIHLALVCIYVGLCLKLESGKLVQLATAALLHDIGILHIAPEILERDHILSDLERRHLYAHPLTAWMILKECADYPQEVLDAVLQHHEHLDGSGYPRGLESDAISPFGKILAVAEIVASRQGDANSALEKIRLEAILKLNSRRYGRQLINHLAIFYRSNAEVPSCSDAIKQNIQNQLHCTLSALSSWEKMWGGFHQGYHSYESINKRVENLKMEVRDAGLAPLDIDESVQGIEDSPRTCFEMHILLDEVIWQLQNILDEIKRRWPDLGAESPASCAVHIQNWANTTERALKSCRTQGRMTLPTTNEAPPET